MFLRRVTITGFKSFAVRTVLDLEPGMTAIVGPNGSGKSNLADAIRWALGEQSKSRLRLEDREEVVFSGTENSARASFAEVVLLFDNEDGKFPIELTAVQISRRLYRSGESEYQLAGRTVKLSDIQNLLAGAGVGLGSYAVIGQGMIDSFLSSSPAERKLMFSDALGIRGPELTRAGAVKRLDQTAANLTRLRDMHTVLTPQLGSLLDSASSDELVQEFSLKVSDLRTSLVSAQIAHWQKIELQARTELEVGSVSLAALLGEQVGLQSHLNKLRESEAEMRSNRSVMQAELQAKESIRDELGSRLASAEARLTMLTSSLGVAGALEGKISVAARQLDQARSRLVELSSQIATNQQARDRADLAVAKSARDVAAAGAALVDLRPQSLGSGHDTFVAHALVVVKALAARLKEGDPDKEEIRLLVNKAGRLLSHATSAQSAGTAQTLQAAQHKLEQAMSRRDTAIEHQTNIAITGRSLDIDAAHQQDEITRCEELCRDLDEAAAESTATASQAAQLQADVGELTGQVELASQAIEQLRGQLALSPVESGSAETLADLAGGLERTRMQIESVVTRQSELQSLKQTSDEGLAAAVRQADEWQIVPVTDVAYPPLGDLVSQLARAEASLEAHAVAAQEKAARIEQAGAQERELAAQISDLEMARSNLEQVIAELDSRIQERFNVNFAELSTQFGAYFTRLFGGGSAKLELESTSDGYTVSVKVTPKGRRSTAPSALSGGERALAGVALLSAILHTNPSPFVVLDEVDAALDEANSSRLSEILTELKSRSQLIVITHNRQTMHAASVLFGITMDSRHVSNLLSLRLEEASRLAAR